MSSHWELKSIRVTWNVLTSFCLFQCLLSNFQAGRVELKSRFFRTCSRLWTRLSVCCCHCWKRSRLLFLATGMMMWQHSSVVAHTFFYASIFHSNTSYFLWTFALSSHVVALVPSQASLLQMLWRDSTTWNQFTSSCLVPLPLMWVYLIFLQDFSQLQCCQLSVLISGF